MDRKFLSLLAIGLFGCPTASTEVCEPECRAGFECIDGECLEASAGGECVPACRSGFECRASSCVEADPNACNPACRSGYVCEAGQCVEMQDPNPQPTATIEPIDLGSISFGGTQVGTVYLDVPEGATSFHVDIRTEAHQEYTSLFRLVAPDGSVLFDYDDPRSPVHVDATNGEAQVLFPNTPKVAISAGRYQLDFATNADQTAPYRVQAVLKRDPQNRSSRISINLFFVGVPGLSAASAPNDPQFARIVSRFTQLYAQAGISVAEVRHHDVSASDAERLGVIDSIEGPGNELDQLFALADAYTDDNLFNFYLVRSISAGGGDGLEILGIADGIPGRVSLPGHLHSGVAVTMGYYQEDPDSVASTMAHEGGHFLGLFHTTERDGSMSDPLPDTPECSTFADTNHDGLLDANECAGVGAQNLMFWLAAPSAVQFTEDQSFVLHQNPAIR